MNCKLAAAGLCLAILLAVPSQASASRPATAEEKAAVSAVYGADPACSEVIVSERDPRYARWDPVDIDCEALDFGFGVARRDGTGWRHVVGFKSEGDVCPTGLPTETVVELRACRKPSRHTYITNYLTGRALFKPRKLPHGAHSFLGPLRWRGWDSLVARARGVLDYSDRFATFKAPIRLRAYRVRFCGARGVYTRLRLTFVRSADRRRYPHFQETRKSDECPSRR